MNSESLVVAVPRTASLYRAAFLSGIVLVAPVFLSQPVTGVFVNMVLVLSALSFGLRRESWFVAIIPSLVASLCGQLPAAFLPMIPFIMAGNVVLIAAFHLSYRRYGNFMLSAATASLFKFLFLSGVGFLFSMVVFSGTPLAGKVMAMFGWVQLLTAIGGSALAFCIFRASNRFFPEQ